MDVWIGTSGYSYPDWVGPFYPPGTRPQAMLAQYARHFPLVELNYTFYRPPTPEALTRLAERTPPGFQFLVKMPRTLSHEERPDDLPGFRASIAALAQRSALLGVLCQLPQASHYGKTRLAWLEQLAVELRPYRLAVEFRHRSWYRPDVPLWLAERQVDLVSVDVPPIDALYPSGLVRSGPRVYVRFHSRKASHWYLGGHDRYDYDYDDAALRGWMGELLSQAGEVSQAMLLFNNCMHSQAADNARRMAELFREAAGGSGGRVHLVEPFAPTSAGPRQRSLFGEDH